MCFNPAFLNARQLRQTHPFSSWIHALFPIAATQYPPFSPQLTQLGHVMQIHMPSTSSIVAAFNVMSAPQLYHTDRGHDKSFVYYYDCHGLKFLKSSNHFPHSVVMMMEIFLVLEFFSPRFLANHIKKILTYCQDSCRRYAERNSGNSCSVFKIWYT